MDAFQLLRLINQTRLCHLVLNIDLMLIVFWGIYDWIIDFNIVQSASVFGYQLDRLQQPFFINPLLRHYVYN